MSNAAHAPRRWTLTGSVFDDGTYVVGVNMWEKPHPIQHDERIEVIEASAYDALLAERDEYKAELVTERRWAERMKSPERLRTVLVNELADQIDALKVERDTYKTACEEGAEIVGELKAQIERAHMRLRHISHSADTLSPQEFINSCADGIGVDRHEYAGKCDPNKSLVERERELAALKIENDEADTLNTMLSRILTDTAHVLKGTPEALHSHSWHDLAQVAAALKEKAERLHSIVLAMARADGRHGFEDIQSIEDAYYRQLEYGVAHPDFLTTSATESRDAKGGTT